MEKTEIIAISDVTDTGQWIAFNFTDLFRQKLATVCFVLCYRYALFADYESYISCQDRVSELYKVSKWSSEYEKNRLILIHPQFKDIQLGNTCHGRCKIEYDFIIKFWFDISFFERIRKLTPVCITVVLVSLITHSEQFNKWHVSKNEILTRKPNKSIYNEFHYVCPDIYITSIQMLVDAKGWMMFLGHTGLD